MRQTILLLLVSLATMFSSCVKDNSDRPTTKTGAVKEVSLTLVAPGGFESALTRAQLPNVSEEGVQSATIVVFKKDGTYDYHKTSTKLNQVGRNITVTVNLRTDNSRYDLLVLTNLSDYFTPAQIDNVLTGCTIDNAYKALRMAAIIETGWGESKFVMSGIIKNYELTSATTTIGTVSLIRSLASVDVGLNWDGASKSWQGLDDFKLEEVYIYNANSDYTVMPKPTAYNNGDYSKVTSPTIYKFSTQEDGVATSIGNTTTDKVLHYDANNITIVGDKQLESKIYIAEVANSSALNKDARPVVVIKGEYKGKSYYYRMDFATKQGDEATLLNILRNHKYRFNVKSILGVGYDTPDEAFNSRNVDLDVDVLPWDEGDIGDLYDDGEYILSVRPGSTFVFYKEGGSQIVSMKTTYPKGWEIVKVTEEDETTPANWITIDKTIGESQLPNEYVDMKITLTSTTEERKGYIYVKAGRITARLIIIQTTEPTPTTLFATFDDGTVISSVNWEENTLKVNITSNQDWTITLNDSSIATLDRTSGSGNDIITVSVNQNGTIANRNGILTVVGGDNTISKLAVIQNRWFPTPPKSGILAPPNILGVGEESGELTLDGTKSMGGSRDENVWVVYYKWGSLLALSGDNNISEYPNVVSWVPAGYAGLINSYANIPYIDATQDDSYLTNGTIDGNKNNSVTGMGDPCKLAIKDGEKSTDWKMPKGNPYLGSEPTYYGNWTLLNNIKGLYYKQGSKEEQYYPAAGTRNETGTANIGINGSYWSSSLQSSGSSYYLFLQESGVVSTTAFTDRNRALAVRCMPDGELIVTPTTQITNYDGGDVVFDVEFTGKYGGFEDITFSSSETEILPVEGEWLSLKGGPVGTDYKYTLTVTVLPNTTGGVNRVAYGHISSNGYKEVVTIRQNIVTPPSTGVLAPPNLLGVGEVTGELTLDGTKSMGGTRDEKVWIVYFKWGSLVGLKDNNGTTGKFATAIGWVPPGYQGRLDSHANVPYLDGYGVKDVDFVTNNELDATKNDLVRGVGDPCNLALKDGKKTTNWRMPKGGPYMGDSQSANYGSWSILGDLGGYYYKKGTEEEQFYPAVGYRPTDGSPATGMGSAAFYWSRSIKSVTGNKSSYGLHFTDGGRISINSSSVRHFGFTVRCVEEKE